MISISGASPPHSACVSRFVCFRRSIRVETRLDPVRPGLNKNVKSQAKKPIKHAGLVIYGNEKRGTDMKIKERGKEDHSHSKPRAPNKSS